MKNYYFIFGLTALLGQSSAKCQTVTTLNPVCDANVYTFGGGQGGNAYLKFDISSVPAGATILSVDFECNVIALSSMWDTDGVFYNVHNQTWTEANMMGDLHGYVKSDTTLQAAGFAMGMGWTTSTDLTNIFLEDYLVANQYCSILIRDPDDGTFAPPAMPLADFDTLVAGNVAFNQHMVFWSSEATDPTLQPKLNITWCMDSESFITTAACDSFTLNAITYYAAGLYTQTLPNASGCDSTINLDLTIGSLDDSIYINDNDGYIDSLKANQAGVSYQWIDCDLMSDIPGATSQDFAVTYNGTFACIVSQGSCIDTSECIYVYLESIDENGSGGIYFYPNPVSGMLNISIPADIQRGVFILSALSGEIMGTLEILDKHLVQMDVAGLPKGVYFASVIYGDSRKISKVVIE